MVPPVDPAALLYLWKCSRASQTPNGLDEESPVLVSAIAFRASIIDLLAHTKAQWRWSLKGKEPDSAVFRIVANWMFRDLDDLDLSALIQAINEAPFTDPAEEDERMGIPSRRLWYRMAYLKQIYPTHKPVVLGDMAFE